eukprot:2165284-Amphidinium_carterae.1
MNASRTLRVFSCFGLCVNSVVGVLQSSAELLNSGKRTMMAMTGFKIYGNSFAGTLPDGGIRAVMGVTEFSLGRNSFAGMLPERGLKE